MLDRNLIRTNPDFVREGIRRKRMDPAIVDQFLDVDAQWRTVKHELDELRAQHKKNASRRVKPPLAVGRVVPVET